MRYGSVCSGIEAATIAWHEFGWKAQFYSEIATFPRKVLQHHFPEVPLHGDFTTIGADEYGTIDLLVGGTPCQDFSVAGLRQGIAGARGQLTIEFVRLAARKKPRWILFENVPGILSDGKGISFWLFLNELAKCGYGISYRVLDAQYFGVPQRRRRVFVVGYLRDWRPAAAVLFERESLQGNITPSRKKGETVTALTATGVGTCGADDNQGQAGHLIAHSLRGEGFDATEDGTGRGIPLIPDTAWALQERDYKGSDSSTKSGHLIPVAIPIHDKATRHNGGGTSRNNDGSSNGFGIGQPGDPMPTLDTAASHMVAQAIPINTQVAFRHNKLGRGTGFGVGAEGDPAFTVGSNHSHALMHAMRVRRLTPRECERLMGIPDDFTLITEKTKDSPRYRALGNSMPVPVMRWLGSRIEQIDGLL